MTQLYLILAQAAPARPQSDILSMLMPMGIAIAIFYLLVFRPQQKQMKDHRALLASLQKGDNIIFSGGIHGKVLEVADRTLMVEIADRVKLKIERTAVSGVIRAGVETRVEELEKK